MPLKLSDMNFRDIVNKIIDVIFLSAKNNKRLGLNHVIANINGH